MECVREWQIGAAPDLAATDNRLDSLYITSVDLCIIQYGQQPVGCIVEGVLPKAGRECGR